MFNVTKHGASDGVDKFGEGPVDLYQIFTSNPDGSFEQVIMNQPPSLQVIRLASVVIYNGNVIKNRYGATTEPKGGFET